MSRGDDCERRERTALVPTLLLLMKATSSRAAPRSTAQTTPSACGSVMMCISCTASEALPPSTAARRKSLARLEATKRATTLCNQQVSAAGQEWRSFTNRDDGDDAAHVSLVLQLLVAAQRSLSVRVGRFDGVAELGRAGKLNDGDAVRRHPWLRFTREQAEQARQKCAHVTEIRNNARTYPQRPGGRRRASTIQRHSASHFI